MTPPKTTWVQLEEDKKSQFIGAVSGGQSVHSAANKYGIHKSMAQDIWTKWKKKGSTENLPCTGHPKKTTEHMERSIIRESLASQRKPFCEIANAASPKISTSTIRNILRQKGYHHRVTRKVPYLTQALKSARLAWAQICKVFTIRNWQKKIWYDECYETVVEGSLSHSAQVKNFMMIAVSRSLPSLQYISWSGHASWKAEKSHWLC